MIIARPDKIETIKVSDATGAPITLKTAVDGKRIHVLGWDLNVASSTTLSIRSATTSLSGLQTVAERWQANFLTFGDRIHPRYTTVENEDLTLDAGGAVLVTGAVYIFQEY